VVHIVATGLSRVNKTRLQNSPQRRTKYVAYLNVLLNCCYRLFIRLFHNVFFNINFASYVRRITFFKVFAHCLGTLKGALKLIVRRTHVKFCKQMELTVSWKTNLPIRETHHIWTLVNQLTAWSRVIFKKLTIAQLVKKFPAYYGTISFITVFTRTRQWSLF
jgi:hypothetical protein